MMSEEEFEPIRELQSRIFKYINFLHFLCKELESPKIINFWMHQIRIEDYELNGKFYDVAEETAYQLLVDLMTGISGELLALIPLTVHVKTTEFPTLAKRIAVLLDHFYVYNLTSWTTQFSQLLVKDDYVREIIVYPSFEKFMEQFMLPEEKAILRTKLNAKYHSLLDANLRDYLNEATQKLDTQQEKKKLKNKKKKKQDKEGVSSRERVLRSEQYISYKDYLTADYTIQKEQEFNEIVQLSLSDPEELTRRDETPLTCTLRPEDIDYSQELFERKEEIEKHIERMQVQCSLYIKLHCLPLLRQALTLLKTPFNLMFLQRQRLEHELELLSSQSQNIDALVKSIASEKQMPSLFGEDKPKDTEKEQEKEVIY